MRHAVLNARSAFAAATVCLCLAASAGALAAEPAVAPATPAAPAAKNCPPPPKALDAAALQSGLRTARDHGFFWRISKGGRSSYLYGTIHAARFEWMFPGPTVQEALAASDTVALELDVLDPGIQRRLAQAIVARNDEPLPEALQKRMEKRRAAECVDSAAWSTFSPEFQIASLGVLSARRDGLDPSYAIDLVLAVVARSQGKPIVSLETPEAQMNALQMPTREERLEFVQSGLDELDSGRSRPVIRRLAKAWTDGNYSELERYTRWCDCVKTASDRASMKRLLDERNPELAEGIDALHSGGKSVFAAVGSLHMIGPAGLPALLKQRGYKVEQGDFAR